MVQKTLRTGPLHVVQEIILHVVVVRRFGRRSECVYETAPSRQKRRSRVWQHAVMSKRDDTGHGEASRRSHVSNREAARSYILLVNTLSSIGGGP